MKIQSHKPTKVTTRSKDRHPIYEGCPCTEEFKMSKSHWNDGLRKITAIFPIVWREIKVAPGWNSRI